MKLADDKRFNEKWGKVQKEMPIFLRLACSDFDVKALVASIKRLKDGIEGVENLIFLNDKERK